jgi:hypothetical protein
VSAAAEIGQVKTDYKKMRTRIEAIVDEAARPIPLKEPSNVAIRLAAVPISSSDIQEIQGYGDSAIPILKLYLLGKSPRREVVAIRLLGAIGSHSILDPLITILDYSPRAASRIEAIHSLKQIPCPMVMSVMQRVSERDLNDTVRQVAKRAVVDCGK